MAGEVYDIQIKLHVNTDELNAAERRLGGLGAGGGTAGSGRGGRGWSRARQFADMRRRAGLTDGQRDFMRGARRFQNRNPWSRGLFNTTNMSRGFADTNRALGRLGKDFTSNLFSINGFRRNLGNFTNVLGQMGGALTKSVPALQAVTNGVAVYAGIRGANMLVSGGIMMAGKKVLMGENIEQAASNLAQMETARNFMGAGYDDIFKKATGIAETYGFDRTGIINTAAAFSNLRPNGKTPLGTDTSLRIAEIVGKTSQYAGADYNKVSRNLQQMMAMPKANMRDINELITQAPIITSIAQQMMLSRTGAIGDTRQFLANKTNVLDVLWELDRKITTHPIMKMRGQISLSKQNLWMKVADNGKAFFGDISKVIVSFNEMIGDRLTKYASMYKAGDMDKMMGDFISTIGSLMDGIVAVVPKIISVLNWADEHRGALTGFATAGPLGALYGWNKDLDRERIAAFEERAENNYRANIASGRANELVDAKVEKVLRGKGLNPRTTGRIEWVAESNKLKEKYGAQWRSEALSIIMTSGTDWRKSDTQGYYNGSATLPYAKNIGAEAYNNFINSGLALPQIDTTTANENSNQSAMSNLRAQVGERRALTINFNKEIVSMPTTVNANDVANASEQLRPMVEDAIASGLMRALASAEAVRP